VLWRKRTLWREFDGVEMKYVMAIEIEEF